ncbi:MAG: 6-phosphogluconolactonase [Xanthomonadales bacterium]|nr:6-phosphogluconolactonase [Xanthomonadales bacterium]
MNLLSLASPPDLARAAAEHIGTCALQAVAQRGRFSLALSGGSTPWLMLNHLARLDLPWDRFHVFQVDERVAPDGDPERNLTHIQAQFTSRVCIPPGQVYAMPVLEEDLDAAANNYMHTLHGLAGMPAILDLVHLGLGGDGHTASLFPGNPVLDSLALDVDIARVAQQRMRMTLTYPVINRARNILWLISGADKAGMLQRLIAQDQSIPAGRVSQDLATIFTDIPLLTT